MTDIKIKPQNRQSLALKITPHGVEVLIPASVDPHSDQVQAFIQAGLSKLPRPQPVMPGDCLSKADILRLTEVWAGRLGVQVGRIRFQPMRQKWGSISTAGNLTLASDLTHLPRHLIEYVVCHELLHLKVPRHNRLYYLLLGQQIPNWQQRERELSGWVLLK